jgi:tRNA (cytidine/uridine-2'-O-)-methyltransferase
VNVVLVEPEIPPNTGNVARLCAATRATLHLVEPFGFQLDDRQLKRAGLDYWRHLDWHRWPDWPAFAKQLPPDARLWMIESHGKRHYAEVEYRPDDFLVFGRETMFHQQARSLNLSNCVALVLYEALRQQGFTGEI